MALLAKFGVLAVKALAKPLANRFKAEAVSHPGWRNVCLLSGRFVNQVTSRVDIYVLNSNKAMKNVKIKPLTEDQAVKTGADFISEFGLVMLAVGLYGAEALRKDRIGSLAKEAKKKEIARKETALQARLDALNAEVLFARERSALAAAKLERLERRVAHRADGGGNQRGRPWLLLWHWQ